MNVRTLKDLEALLNPEERIDDDETCPGGNSIMSQRYKFAVGRLERGAALERTEEMIEQAKDAYKFRQKNGGLALAVDESVHKFAANFWHDETIKLQFTAPTRDYMECHKEVARRHPWVYLAVGLIADDGTGGITISEHGR